MKHGAQSSILAPPCSNWVGHLANTDQSLCQLLKLEGSSKATSKHLGLYTPSPRITRFPITRISTYMDFSLCTYWWGNSALVETLVQSH